MREEFKELFIDEDSVSVTEIITFAQKFVERYDVDYKESLDTVNMDDIINKKFLEGIKIIYENWDTYTDVELGHRVVFTCFMVIKDNILATIMLSSVVNGLGK